MLVISFHRLCQGSATFSQTGAGCHVKNSVFLPATRVLTVVMAAYVRKTTDPPNPLQYDMSPFDTTVTPSFDTKAYQH
ncbi:hypothetical protein T11_6457 [Trichinella zimbabwensis]|uniref:Uncharacterized protein n=1 Tax=Trichinella zimbabwensis TaxID=268475 RepID=A0A0V1GNG7_9BILA|nr:hypothetical protein T11_6457 [Trichinella zimbabwensis]